MMLITVVCGYLAVYLSKFIVTNLGRGLIKKAVTPHISRTHIVKDSSSCLQELADSGGVAAWE